jgi:hypothetical protein
MAHIDIDSLTEAELRDLNNRVTERLRLLSQVRAHRAMMEFAIGDRVTFNADGRTVVGVIARYNRKTVTLIADGGERWNVSPGLLRPAQAERRRENVRVVVRPTEGPGQSSQVVGKLGRLPGA